MKRYCSWWVVPTSMSLMKTRTVGSPSSSSLGLTSWLIHPLMWIYQGDPSPRAYKVYLKYAARLVHSRFPSFAFISPTIREYNRNTGIDYVSTDGSFQRCTISSYGAMLPRAFPLLSLPPPPLLNCLDTSLAITYILHAILRNSYFFALFAVHSLLSLRYTLYLSARA